MIFAVPGRGVAVRLEDLADGRFVLGDDAVVAGIAGRSLADHAETHRVMIAPGDKGRPRRRAQRGGVKLRVTQSHIGDAVERRGWNDAAECARRGKAHVVGDDQQNVGRALRRHHLRLPVGGGVESIEVNRAAEGAGGRRYLPPVDCRRGAGRTWITRRLLGHGRGRPAQRFKY